MESLLYNFPASLHHHKHKHVLPTTSLYFCTAPVDRMVGQNVCSRPSSSGDCLYKLKHGLSWDWVQECFLTSRICYLESQLVAWSRKMHEFVFLYQDRLLGPFLVPRRWTLSFYYFRHLIVFPRMQIKVKSTEHMYETILWSFLETNNKQRSSRNI